MSRFTPYLGIVAALAVGILIAVFSSSTSVVFAPTKPVITTTTSADKPAATTSVETSANVPKNSATTSPPEVKIKNIPTFEPVPPTSVAPIITPPSPVSDSASSELRNALVNIVCYAPVGGVIHSISASGVFIDPKGIILTNAHVGQYFLLADRGVSCKIRSGSPALDRYNAKLIYISPAWLRANPNVLTEESPNGTGEYDFALLAVSGSATASPLPSLFPSVTLALNPPAAGASVVIAS